MDEVRCAANTHKQAGTCTVCMSCTVCIVLAEATGNAQASYSVEKGLAWCNPVVRVIGECGLG